MILYILAKIGKKCMHYWKNINAGLDINQNILISIKKLANTPNLCSNKV